MLSKNNFRKIIYSVLYSGFACSSVSSVAGVRQDVYSELEKITGNWSDADLSVSVGGVTGEVPARVGDSISYKLASTRAGNFILVHVDSHGTVTLILPDCPSTTQGAEYHCSYPEEGALKVQPPLGKETLYLVFTETAVSRDSIGVEKGQSFVQLEDSVALASKIRQIIQDYAVTGKVAVSKKEYLVEGAPGTTQYTTRSIIRQFDDSDLKKIDVHGEVMAQPLAVDMIQFEFGSSRLTTQGMINLDIFGEAFLSGALSDQSYLLVGHTDSIGTEEANMVLSWDRARVAKAYLVDHFGIDTGRIEVDAYGETRPRASNSNAESRTLNRRVEFMRTH